MNKCKKCYRKIDNCNSLLKLKDNNWYCLSCIIFNKEIFNLLKINGYWYNILKKRLRFKLDD